MRGQGNSVKHVTFLQIKKEKVNLNQGLEQLRSFVHWIENIAGQKDYFNFDPPPGM